MDKNKKSNYQEYLEAGQSGLYKPKPIFTDRGKDDAVIKKQESKPKKPWLMWFNTALMLFISYNIWKSSRVSTENSSLVPEIRSMLFGEETNLKSQKLFKILKDYIGISLKPGQTKSLFLESDCTAEEKHSEIRID